MTKHKQETQVSPEGIGMSLDDLVRRGARQVIQQAIEAELAELLAQYSNVKTLAGSQAVVRNSYLQEREVLTAAGPVAVQVPKVRDRSGAGVKLNSAIVPPYVRKAPRVSAALPWLYLKGISTGDIGEALSVLLGEDAKGLSPNVVSRLRGSGRTNGSAGTSTTCSASAGCTGGLTASTSAPGVKAATGNACW